MMPVFSVNDRVAAAAKAIDATVDDLVQKAESQEEVQYLEAQRNELHALLAARAIGQAIDGHQLQSDVRRRGQMPEAAGLELP